MKERSLPTAALVNAGVLAGLVGGVTIDGYLLVMVVLLGHAATVTGFYQFVASGLVGKAAFSSPNFAWLGLALHFFVSIVWGVGYAFAAAGMPQVRARPLVSGLAFGVVVFVAMQVVELAANLWQPPSPVALLRGLVAHLVFFGVPVAYVVSGRLDRA